MIKDQMDTIVKGDNPDETEKRTLQVQRSNAPTHVEAWVNNASIFVGFYDMTLNLGVLREVDKECAKVEEYATIHMSPEHALSLQELLASQLKVYESRWGKIRRLTAAESVNASDSVKVDVVEHAANES